jgi:hypothetical protein
MTLADKIDDIGKPAWIGLTVLSFAAWWPLGLGLLAYLAWSRRMGCWGRAHHERWQDRWQDKMNRLQAKMDRLREHGGGWGGTRGASSNGGGWRWEAPSSGNRAFDEYRAETMRRLEEEQREFKDFLERLRQAKDKAEFDQFMADRRNRPASPPPQPDAAT